MHVCYRFQFQINRYYGGLSGFYCNAPEQRVHRSKNCVPIVVLTEGIAAQDVALVLDLNLRNSNSRTACGRGRRPALVNLQTFSFPISTPDYLAVAVKTKPNIFNVA